MKTNPSRVFPPVAAMFCALLLTCLGSTAKDVPVDSKSLVGQWMLLEVKTQDKSARSALLEREIVMSFQANRSVIVESRNPDSMSGVDSRKGSYQVDGGKITITLDGEPADEPAQAIIRDGKHLVFLPSEKFAGEMIFARVKK